MLHISCQHGAVVDFKRIEGVAFSDHAPVGPASIGDLSIGL